MYFVYVLRCADSSLYCGYTTDVAHRMKAHTGNAPGGAKYTRIHAPLRVERVWRCEEKSDALRLEIFFKKLPKASKEKLVSEPSFFAVLFKEKLDAPRFFEAAEFEGDLTEASDGNMESVARLP